MQNKTSILLVYTGGTIGMKQDPVSFDLRPFDFSQILEEVPELKKFGYRIDTYSFDPVIDSSDVDIEFWKRLTRLIEDNYGKYDGFVILHGTDTMSFSASALSFMLGDIAKPVVFTGSQLPIGMLRTDGKENLISSIEIAASKDSCGRPMVPEVCIYFESQLYRATAPPNTPPRTSGPSGPPTTPYWPKSAYTSSSTPPSSATRPTGNSRCTPHTTWIRPYLL